MDNVKENLTQVFGNEFVHSLVHGPEKKVDEEEEDPLLAAMVGSDADDDETDGPSKPQKSRRTNEEGSLLLKLPEQMRAALFEFDEEERKTMSEVQQDGRLGPSVVKMNVADHVGTFIVSTDRLGVNSQCNFGSIKANVCVFKGKWQYEAQLGSNGVMQVGWATQETRFSQEKGVGDTFDSYAYDGNRVRKWNKTQARYGETWQAGDIIGCCIDLDEGKIEFFRNGKSMGVAFTGIRRGPKVAYFPAVSLAYQENTIVNFGATPLQFPVPGYNPLQKERTVDNKKASLILSWLKNLLPLFRNGDTFLMKSQEDKELVIVGNRIMELLGPHLYSGFVVEHTVCPFLASVLGLPSKISHEDIIPSSIPLNYDGIALVLDLMWGLLEESEIRSCMERICVLLMNQFRANSMSLNYPFQRYSLYLLTALLKHRRTRRHFIRNLLLDRSGRIFHFLHVRPIDESSLSNTIQYSMSSEEYENICKEISRQVTEIESLQVALLKQLLDNTDGTDKRPSSRAMFLRRLRMHLRDIVRPGSVLHQPIQKAMCTFFCILKTVSDLHGQEIDKSGQATFPTMPSSLFYDTSLTYFDLDRVGGLASFLYKTHHIEVSNKLAIPDYIQQEQLQQPSSSDNSSSPGPTRPTFVSTGVSTDDNLMEIAIVTLPMMPGAPPPPPPLPPAPTVADITARAPEPSESPSNSSSTETVTAPPPTFRGAIMTGTPSGHNMLLPMIAAEGRNFGGEGFTFYPMGFGTLEHRNTGIQPKNPAVELLGKDSGVIDPLYSLRELLDDAIAIFNSGVVSNIEKAATLRKSIQGYQEALNRATESLSDKNNTPDRNESLSASIKIFKDKLNEQWIHLAWIKSAVFTKERQIYADKLLKVLIQTLKAASNEGPLFTFVPEHYISTLVNLNNFILQHLHPTVPYDNLPDIEQTRMDVAEFVATHFADPRIIVADTKDILSQALSSYICHPLMIKALEEMPLESRMTMVKAVLRPYENRAWAQNNWMLVRMWQGDGFAFQYPTTLDSRRSFRSKPIHDEYGITTILPPTPSKTFQHLISEVLLGDQSLAVKYIHSVLNQLNWSFSEFVGLLQEIQSSDLRPRNGTEPRQLKVCCTCFELTQSLLRVMELIVSVAPAVLTDFTRESAEPLLGRLAMLLSQVMNRVGSNSGSFAAIVESDIPGMETINYFPLLSAVAGIIVSLIEPELTRSETEISATKTMISEPSFQPNSLDFLLGRNQTHVPEGRQTFSLAAHVPYDATAEEIQRLENVIEHINAWSQKLQTESEVIDDDNICPICYAHEMNATLKPCNHKTCRSCIVHHLMNRGDCFFCKAPIQQVFLDDGTKIHDITSNQKATQ